MPKNPKRRTPVARSSLRCRGAPTPGTQGCAPATSSSASTHDHWTTRRSFNGCWRIRKWGRPRGSKCCVRDAGWTCRSRLPAHGVRGNAVAPRAGDGGAVEGVDSPLLLDRDIDPDSAAPFHPAYRQAVILNPQRARRQVVQVVPQIDAQGFRQVTWSAAQFVYRELARALHAGSRTTPSHQWNSVFRLQRTDQHRRRPAFGLGDRVHQVVDAVIEVNVRNARRAVEWRVARCRAGRRVTGLVALADIRFRFDDDA